MKRKWELSESERRTLRSTGPNGEVEYVSDAGFLVEAKLVPQDDESVADPAARAIALADLIDEEVYYGFNLRTVLAELAINHPSRFIDLEWVFNRVRKEREDLSNR